MGDFQNEKRGLSKTLESNYGGSVKREGGSRFGGRMQQDFFSTEAMTMSENPSTTTFSKLSQSKKYYFKFIHN